MNPFPILIIVLNIMSAGWYFWGGDFRRGIYWVAASVLNLCIFL